ncbi:LysR family transcriptional regulator [Paraburkholderia strydomiana]|uniref:LysR family transcriptional regulator n=1 Tax=Paraburkholderia strydomiana TaxID=1245417 RepID=UPI0038B80A99
MIRLDDLALFVRSAATGSFSSAARELDLLPAQVSAAIKRLEDELGIRLFARSTRSLRLTAEGERYLPFANQVLSTLQEGNECLRPAADELSGVLQVAVPSDLGRNVLLEPLTAFRRDNPKLELRLHVSDVVTDVFRDPADIAIRYGVMDDASYISMPIASSNRRVLFASPDYLRRHGRPESLDDLVEHSCLIYMIGGRPYDKWEFQQGNGMRTISVSGPLVTNDADIVRRWAVAGEGIGYKSELDVIVDVLAGRLEILLPETLGKQFPLNLICPHRRQFSTPVQHLYARLQAYCGNLLAHRHPKSGQIIPA